MEFVALLRGVNVGGRTIKMAEVKTCFEEMGLEEVTTVLQSGNVVFRGSGGPPSLKRAIESGLRDTFHYPAHVQVYKMAQLRRIIEASPFGGTDPDLHSYVLFFEDGLDKQMADEASQLDLANERVQAGEGVVYWQVPKGSTLQSGIGKYLTKARYKDFHTNRNINTLRKIVR
jgi:uncharacterized protein (DUF1697 family)